LSTKRVLGVAFVMCVLIAGVACGGSKKSSSGSTPTGADQAPSTSNNPAATTIAVPSVGAIQQGTNVGDACSIVSKDDVSTALGQTVGAGQGTSLTSQSLGPGLAASVSGCDFTSSSGATVNVVLYKVAGGTSSAQLKQIFQQIICAQKESVSGLGDVACWYDSSHTEIQVMKGLSFVDITISTPGRGDQLKSLAAKAVSKL
jgi:hypothetical protein